MEIILSTRNPSKMLQIQKVFEGSSVTLLSLDDVGVEGEAIEDGTTLEENSFKKAIFAHEKSGGTRWTMADDTGLYITALNGEPGIYAARWAGETASTQETLEYCLNRMDNITDRSAAFRTTVVAISPDGEKQIFLGEVEGSLLATPRVEPQPKMPYSALFVPNGQDLCWAEMTTEQENEISHRGMAFRKARTFFESLTA